MKTFTLAETSARTINRRAPNSIPSKHHATTRLTLFCPLLSGFLSVATFCSSFFLPTCALATFLGAPASLRSPETPRATGSGLSGLVVIISIGNTCGSAKLPGRMLTSGSSPFFSLTLFLRGGGNKVPASGGSSVRKGSFASRTHSPHKPCTSSQHSGHAGLRQRKQKWHILINADSSASGAA
jgi:hypothetical protein